MKPGLNFKTGTVLSGIIIGIAAPLSGVAAADLTKPPASHFIPAPAGQQVADRDRSGHDRAFDRDRDHDRRWDRDRAERRGDDRAERRDEVRRDHDRRAERGDWDRRDHDRRDHDRRDHDRRDDGDNALERGLNRVIDGLR